MGKIVIDTGTLRKQLSLYLVMGMSGWEGRTALEIASEAIAGGVTMIQWREKEKPLREVLDESRSIRELCRQKGVPFIVNDRVDIALLLDADGVHVGQDDLPGTEVRKLFGPGKIIGISAGNIEEAAWALEQGADYLGIGPVFSTATKLDAGGAIGFGLIRSLAKEKGIPMVGIGGIHSGNAGDVVAAGADGIAVVSAITRSTSPKAAAASLSAILKSSL
jgi:thiamine-phosphate pyrophosphorylase